MGLSKWEQKQAAAKAAEEKFADNQRRLAKHKEKQKRKGKGAGEGEAAALDDIGSQLGDVDIGKRVGPLGWLIGHKWILGVLAVLAAGGVIFGLMHSPQGWWGMVAIAVGGVALGLMFLAEQSLLMPTVAHYVVNMLQISYAYWRGVPNLTEMPVSGPGREPTTSQPTHG